MIETLSVSFSGPAFSFLLYENMKSAITQEGFLLGEFIQRETSTITDNDQRQVRVSRVVKVNSIVPCPYTSYFYDGLGRVELEKIKHFLGDLAPKVVAWYKYKPSSSFNFTFRERIVHSQLSNLFAIPSDFFTCCFLTTESSDNGSTQSYTQNFVRYNSYGYYEQLPFHIVNLSDPNNTYKFPEKVSESFLKVLEGLNINHEKSQGVAVITSIQSALQKKTNSIVEELAEAEQDLFELETEVKNLRSVLKSRDFASASVNKETQLNNLINKDTDSMETNVNKTNKKSTRGRGRAAVNAKSGNRQSHSPSKKTNAETNREITTRSRRK